MDSDRTKGNLKTIGGKLLSMVGDATGDTESRVKGRAAIAAGRSQNAYGQAKDIGRDISNDAANLAEETYDNGRQAVHEQYEALNAKIKERPVAATLIAAGVGYLLTTIFARR